MASSTKRATSSAHASTPLDRSQIDVSTPVLLLGGRENCTAVARNLGRLGIPVYVSGTRECHAMRSRYCRRAFRIPDDRDAATSWYELLLDNPPEDLRGCIIFPTCDESLEFVTEHHDALSEHFIVHPIVPDLRRAMLDKQETLVLARSVGVPTPNFWSIETLDDARAIEDQITFPVMVKPINSQSFSEQFGRKLFIVEKNFDEVLEKVRLAHSHGQKVMVVEMIPGPDNLLTSYYTYRTAEGDKLYHYTKSVIRRWPVNRGGGSFHQSEWLPETAELGQKLFDGIGWQGIGNVEFKRDLRDGKLKIIEVNARITAAHRLITEGGAPIDLIVYCHLTGQEEPQFRKYSQSLRMWYPLRDLLAFLELRQAGELTLRQWLRSIRKQRVVLPSASLNDPMPAIAEAWSIARKGARKLAVKLFSPLSKGRSAQG